MSEEKNKIKCSICNSEFECGANTNTCWCNELPRVMSVNGDSCWCPKCLEEKIREQENNKENPV